MDHRKTYYRREVDFTRRSSLPRGMSDQRRSSTPRGPSDQRRSSTPRGPSDRRRPSTPWGPSDRRRSSTPWGPSDRRRSSTPWGPSDQRRPSTPWEPSDRRRSSTPWGPSGRRRSSTPWGPSGRRRSSVPRRPSDRRRSSVPRRPSDRRRSSVPRRPSDRRRSSSPWRSPARGGSTERRSSARRLSHVSPDEESLFSDSEEFDSDWGSDEYSEMDGSEHTLSTTVKTNIQMEEDGLGLILIQNGLYLQISGLVEKSAAARDGKLQSGDTLLKIGHANVLGWTLRELRQLLHTTPIGTVLQIQVYRDFMKLPSRWQAALENIPERKGPEIDEVSSCGSEELWTSSEGSYEVTGSDHIPGGADSDKEEEEEEEEQENGDDVIGGGHTVSFDEDGVCTRTGVTGAPLSNRIVHSETFRNVKAVPSLSLEPSKQPKWISKDWHIFERKTYTFTVGSDIGCDIMIHQDFEAEIDTEVTSSYLRPSSPYWTMLKQDARSSSSSSVSDAFWLENFAYDFE